ncbi:ParM/StbA family protein (plasmid) [Brevibacillus halotolerans]|nr:ParM/StbA family protein [Brevibacillus halotolerans]
MANSAKLKRTIISVDSGKFKTKGVHYENGETKKRFEVSTKINPTTEKASTSRSSYVVTLNDQTTMIGGLAGEYNYDTSKAQEVHRRATYLALSKLVEDAKKPIVLSIGCPLSVWFNTNLRLNYMQFMLDLPKDDLRDPNEGNFNLKFEVDGEKFEYNIEHLLVYPETSGFLIKNEEKYAGRSIAVVDIGGLNVNGVVYQPTGEDGTLEPNEDTFFTLNKGGNVFMTELQKVLNTRFGTNIQVYEMNEHFKRGYIKVNKEESAKIIKDFTDAYLDEIRHKMKAHSWSVETLDFAWVGGGSLLFKEHILAIPVFADSEISDTAVWDNAEGFAQATEDAFDED